MGGALGSIELAAPIVFSAMRIPTSARTISAIGWGLAVSVFYSAHEDNRYQAHEVLIAIIVSCLYNWLLLRDPRKVVMVALPWGVSAGLLCAAIVHALSVLTNNETVRGREPQALHPQKEEAEDKGIESRILGKYSYHVFP